MTEDNIQSGGAEIALSFYEEFYSLIEQLEGFNVENFNEEHLASVVMGFKTLLTILDEVPVKSEFTLDQLPYKCGDIQRLNIGGDIVRMSIEGYSIQEIAERFQLKEVLIRRFLCYYNKLSTSNKHKIRKISVFNTTEQLENMLVYIQQQLNRLQGTNDEVAVQYVRELREVIKAASTLSERMVGMHLYTQFTQTVMEVLLTELPGRRHEILERLGTFSKTTKLFIPPTN